MMSSTRDSVIGLLTWDYLQPKGGMGRSLQRIVQTLRTGERTVTVLAPRSDAQAFLPVTHRVGGQMLFSALLLFTLHTRLRRSQVAELLLPVGPGGVLLLRRPPVPATAIVYHSYAQQAALVPGQRWKKIFRPLERRTLRFCQRILCFSADTRDALIAAYHINPDRITVLPHAIDLPASVSSHRERGLCVCVARLEQRKGVEVLLRAWPTIVAAQPHARLVIIGDGVQRAMIDRMIASSKNVERRSSVTQKELEDLLSQAEIAFCPASLEGFGLACAEAMAAGCVVIASDTDGLRQLVDSDSGVLVPVGDSSALAEATIRVLSDHALSEKLSHAGVQRVQSLCNPQTADAALRRAVLGT